MARRLIWSPRALDDLAEISAWIARDSLIYAHAVVGRFFERADALPDQPGQGRRVPEYEGPDEMREVFVHRWRMIYQVMQDRVEIVTLVHGARLIEGGQTL
ncbi:MAG: type II toxin-antitoxin system RelE/ParE family toxin [Gemmobacter sp.]